MSDIPTNPKCSVCKCYFIPTIKSSGLPYKSCEKCRNRDRTKKENKKCEHDKRKDTCRECGGSSICEHNKFKSICRECGGGSICEHNRCRSKCKECGGGSICIHSRERTKCRECGGGSICIHSRVRSSCKECRENESYLRK